MTLTVLLHLLINKKLDLEKAMFIAYFNLLPYLALAQNQE
jgi:hypothetical protein